MQDNEFIPGSVPEQPVLAAPLKKKSPLLWVLVGIVVLIGLANLSNLIGSKSKKPLKSTLVAQPAAISHQQVSSFQAQQSVQAQRDQEQQRIDQSQWQTLQAANSAASDIPGPEADSAAPMTAAQRQSIYGGSSNAPQRTSTASQAHAEAKQRELARAKLRQDALNSDTVAIDFSQQGTAGKPAAPVRVAANNDPSSSEDALRGSSTSELEPRLQTAADQHKIDPAAKADPMGAYSFDGFAAQLYRVFEGTVLEGVVTNHIDGAFAGPILVMLTTDYYSHDHQQLLMPQGTRLIGSVQSVSGQGQRKLMVTFHRAVCPDGFSLDLDKYMGLDPIGTTGLASSVNNQYLSSFAAAAVIGGIAGLAQIGNNGSVLEPSTQIRNGISQQTAQESEQILNKFLSRLPIITLKEGSRARVYISRDILIPSYAEHRVEPTL